MLHLSISGFQPLRNHEQLFLQLPIQFHGGMKKGIESMMNEQGRHR
jgi:hypothetical protein